jgi:hypothetical protein
MAMVVQVVVVVQMNEEHNKRGKITLYTHIELQQVQTKHKKSHHPMFEQSSKEQTPQSCASTNKVTKNSTQSTRNLALALSS